jgi:hypothetical protein
MAESVKMRDKFHAEKPEIRMSKACPEQSRMGPKQNLAGLVI